MTLYMLSVWHKEGDPQPDEATMQQMFADVDRFNRKVQDAGIWVFGGGLEAPEIATVVRSEGGEVIVTDGPFGETKEHLGGFWVLEAPDLDAALDLAARASAACMGPVEVRPFQPEPE